MEQAADNFQASRSAVLHLVESLVNRWPLSLKHHYLKSAEAKSAREAGKAIEAASFLTEWGQDHPGDKRRLERMQEAGCWLSVIPNRLDGFYRLKSFRTASVSATTLISGQNARLMRWMWCQTNGGTCSPM